ncbi:MAG: hypothetical protein AB7H93_23645 [Vicinamibacterales bacterium]
MNIAFASPALVDAATVTTSSSPASLPAANLLDNQPGVACRLDDLDDAAITVDLGAAQTVDTLALLHHTGSAWGGCRVTAGAVEADLGAGAPYDSGVLPLRSYQDGAFGLAWADEADDPRRLESATHHFVLFLETPPRFRWWRFEVLDTGNADGFVDVGRLIVSRAWRPAIGVAYGYAAGFAGDAPREVAAGNQLWPLDRPLRRALDGVSLPFLTLEEADREMARLQRGRGTAGPLLCLLDPTDRARDQEGALYGLWDFAAPRRRPRARYVEVVTSFEELRP